MRITLLLLCCILALSSAGQFPQSWLGNWKGEMHWFKNGATEPQKVPMQLRIGEGDSSGTYQWQIQYGDAGADNRPYLLKAVNAAAGHWVIDERNGIILDQFWLGNRLCGAFTVQSSSILNSYWLEGEELHVEFYSLSAKPVRSSGEGTEESPKVDSYRAGSYQKAVLHRVK